MALLSFTPRVSRPDGTTTPTLSTFQRLNSEQQTPQNIQKLGKFFTRNVMNFVIIIADSLLKTAVHGASTTFRILLLILKTKQNSSVIYFMYARKGHL